MSNIPKPQKYLTYFTWFFTGLMGLGGFLGVINDTLDVVTPRVSIFGTLLIITFYFGAQQYLKHYPWHNGTARITHFNIGMALPLIGMIALLWLPQILKSFPEKRAFPSEQEGETLIVIATFYHSAGIADVAVHDEIRRAIQDKINQHRLLNVRVAVEPTIIRSEERNLAEAIAKEYNASIIIWGADTGVRIEVNFLNLKEPEFYAANINISETQQTQIAKPDAYSQFIVHELPNQLAFLTLFAISQSEYMQVDYNEAIALLEDAIFSLTKADTSLTSDLGIEQAYFRLATLYLFTEQTNMAIQAYESLLSINPDHPQAYNNLGVSYIRQGEYEKAINVLSQAIASNPDESNTYYNRGNAYFFLTDFQNALEDYDQAVKLDPENATAYYNRGVYYSALQQHQSALPDYEQAINIDPNYGNAYTNRGNTLSMLGNYQSALKDYDLAITINPNDASAHYNKGLTLANLGQYEQALIEYELALKTVPNNPDVYYNQGTVHFSLGNYQKAIMSFEHLITLNPEDIRAYIGRGAIYSTLSKYDFAIADFNKAISIDASHPESYLNRAIVFDLTGEHDKALADFLHYLELVPEAEQQIEIKSTINRLKMELQK